MDTSFSLPACVRNASPKIDYALGLDVGVLSLGWAALELRDDQPVGLLDAGVRCWDLLNTAETDIQQGKETPPGQARRQSRQIRRQLFRRAQRLRRTWRALHQLEFFPQAGRSSTARKAFLEQLDAEARSWLRQNLFPNADPPNLEDTWPYHLRSAALDRPLPSELLGRIFFHLAQRRGFQSTAKTRQQAAPQTQKGKAAKKEEPSEVKAGIAQLRQAMEAAGARTLGEYFARLDPHQERIRGRWTSRQMYREEFEALWAAQARFHPEWTPEHKELLFRAIFFQRPLKSQKGLIGLCPLESKFEYLAGGRTPKVIFRHRRAPMASLEAQRIRYVQRINDLEFTDPLGLPWWLSTEHRQRLYALAETHEKLSFAAIRKALGIPTGKKGEGWKCNLEEGKEEKLPGNTTAARIRRILGDQAWQALGPDGQKRLVDTLLAYLSSDALQKALQTTWGFDAQTAQKLADLDLESGYHSFSRRAIRKLLPLLEQGLRLNEAIHRVYGERAGASLRLDRLPPVRHLMPSVRNPLLMRALTEVRKVVNALIRKYGKPARIHIELARDLKRSRREREKLSAQMREQEKRRENARQLAAQFLGRQPTKLEILKVLLAEECDWQCPYTGRKIELAALIGEEPQFEVEHIWPFDRSLDDSFANKTLCYHEENRRKGNRTPWEAYGGDPQRWAEIIDRVKKFQGPWAKEKLRRFLTKELPQDFPNRHLSDTRWITRAAADYLAVLYGGQVDSDGRRRIHTTTGGLTAIVRRAWNLDSILGPGVDKNRADHRQHAIDALIVALTDAGLVHRLSRAAAQLPQHLRYRMAIQLDPPWPGFLEQAKEKIRSILVSFRPHHRLSGPLHKQTYYAPPVPDLKDPEKFRTKVRKSLEDLSVNEVAEIVDPAVRQAVQEKLQALAEPDPKKAFVAPENLPYLRSRKGHIIPIKSVRIWKSETVVPIGSGPRRRWVKTNNNHHLEIFAHLDAQGNEIRWDGRCVSLWEAVQRYRQGLPIVCRDHGPNTRFKFSLACGDYIEWTTLEGEKQILRVVGISHNNIEFRLPYDARPSTLIKKEKARIIGTYPKLFRQEARKVTVSPIGEVFPAGD